MESTNFFKEENFRNGTVEELVNSSSNVTLKEMTRGLEMFRGDAILQMLYIHEGFNKNDKTSLFYVLNDSLLVASANAEDYTIARLPFSSFRAIYEFNGDKQRIKIFYNDREILIDPTNEEIDVPYPHYEEDVRGHLVSHLETFAKIIV